jgi:hypothetical protein
VNVATTGAGTADAAEELGWQQRARQAQRAVDTDRAQRRHRALADRPVVPPPRLGEAFRRRNLFLLPSDDEDGAGQAPATDDAEAR